MLHLPTMRGVFLPALVLPTKDVHEVFRLHLNAFAVIELDLPPLDVRKALMADETFLAVEECISAESHQANIKLETQVSSQQPRNFGVQGSGWNRYHGAMCRGDVIA
uniref:Uncharacterized protein n=1 Tax=Mantoniella antarctica TaxID=81844 RepID=A0A7S0SUM0_9CHLO